jgi:hypothetical protein
VAVAVGVGQLLVILAGLAVMVAAVMVVALLMVIPELLTQAAAVAVLMEIYRRVRVIIAQVARVVQVLF